MAEELTAELSTVSPVRRKLIVTVPSAEVDQEFKKSLAALQRKAVMPGYRKGHVPMQTIRQLYLEDVRGEVAQDLISRAYGEALKKTGARPVNNPDVKEYHLAEGQHLTFTAEFEVRPEVTLPAYKGLELVKEVEEVGDEDVQRVLEDLRRKTAPVRDLAEERGIREGDIALIDFEGFSEGSPVPGGKGSDYHLEIGSGTLIPGFEDALVGLRVGEEKQFILPFPADFKQEALAGKDGQFSVKVKGVKVRVPQPLDDDFAKDAGPYASLEELRGKVRENMTSVREREARSALKQKAVDKILASAEFELPPSMLESEEMHIMSDFARRVGLQGMPPEEARKRIEEIRPDVTLVARKNVKVAILLDEIARAEGLHVEPADIDKAIAELAERYRKPPAEVRRDMIKSGTMEGFQQALLEEKSLDFLLEKSTITVVQAPKRKGGERG